MINISENINPLIYPLTVLVIFVALLLMTQSLQATQKYGPSHVFSQVEYANHIADALLENRNIRNVLIPKSHEIAAKPMHVYELQASVLAELYISKEWSRNNFPL